MSHRTRSGRKFGVQQRSKKANEKIYEDEDGGVHRNELMKLTKAQLVQKLLDLNARESDTTTVSSSSSSSSSAAVTAATSSSSTTTSSSSSSSSSRSFQRPRSSIHGPSSRRSIDLTGYVSLLEGLFRKDVSQRIVSFLPASSILRLRCISTGLKKSVEKYEIANFTSSYLFRDQVKVLPRWQYLCTKSTSLVELQISISPYESCVIESLLTRCDCSSLRCVILHYQGTVFGPYIFHHGMERDFKLKWENNSSCPEFDPNKLLIHVDPTFQPIAQKDHRDVLSILSSKCAASLTKLRVPLSDNRDLMGADEMSGDGHSSLNAISLHAFHNLIDLEVSMGEPSSVLKAVESLCMLRRFTWLSNRIGLKYDKHKSPSYVLRSKSLRTLELKAGKNFYLADINCSSLQFLKLPGGGLYGGTILCGNDVCSTNWFDRDLTVYCVSDSVRYSGKEMVKATAFYGVFYEKEWSEVSYVDERGEFGVAGEMTNWRFAIVFKELSLPSECNVTIGF